MSAGHDPSEAIGRVTHYYGHLSVAAVSLSAPLALGDRIHIHGHSTDVEQTVASLEVEHTKVQRAAPGEDVALLVDGHVREHDLIYPEA